MLMISALAGEMAGTIGPLSPLDLPCSVRPICPKCPAGLQEHSADATALHRGHLGLPPVAPVAETHAVTNPRHTPQAQHKKARQRHVLAPLRSWDRRQAHHLAHMLV